MLYKITIERGYLKADLFNRETVKETQEFFDIVVDSALQHRCSRILMSVHASSPLFAVERSGFLARFKSLSGDPSHKIALVGDTEELGFSHQYIEALGRQQGMNVRNFRDERSGVAWFTADSVLAGA
ncbi:MAG TPA: hypothetical protein VKS43_01500 [Burkholderiales bacterium]|nr:hypothetical protein [Burkholderiales bacterium]